MSRYNSYYPNMQAAGRNTLPGCGRMSQNRNMCSETGNTCPPACPQPPALCCAPENGSCTGDALPVAMAYGSWQNWQTRYAPETALCRGTIFPCLDLPFLAYKGVRV